MTDEEGAVLRATVEALQAENGMLRRLVQELEAQNEGLNGRLAELEKQSKTPSFVKGNRAKKEGPAKARKKRAAQHNQARRREEPTRVERHAVEECTRSGCRASPPPWLRWDCRWPS